jgi:hypothetical protein
VSREFVILRKTPVQLALLVADALVFLASGILFYVFLSRVAGPSLLGQYSLVYSPGSSSFNRSEASEFPS